MVFRNGGFWKLMGGRNAYDVISPFTCRVCLFGVYISTDGWKTVSLGWRNLFTLGKDLTCYVKCMCCQVKQCLIDGKEIQQEMTKTGYMQIPAGRGGE